VVALAVDPAVTFTLDGYEPVAFHTHPALTRAAEARTQVLPPAEPVVGPTLPSQPVSVPKAPSQPVEAYLVGIDATALLQQQLADFLDSAGVRRDVWVSVGVGRGSRVEWVLRSAVPYGVHALPRYPATEPVTDSTAVAAAAATTVSADAADQPDRRRLLVLVWGRPPAAVNLRVSLASALVLHCVDAELDGLPPGGWGPSWLLSRSRPRPRRSLLAHAGQLLTGWEAFREVPDGLALTRLG
jgi:hypothetical protein